MPEPPLPEEKKCLPSRSPGREMGESQVIIAHPEKKRVSKREHGDERVRYLVKESQFQGRGRGQAKESS